MNFDKLKNLMDDLVETNHAPGNTIVVYSGNEQVFNYSCGYSDFEKKIPMTGEEYFNFYSCSKVATVTAALQLLEKGKFLLFIISTFLMIMTNYYFSVSALVFLFVYAVYLLLKQNEKLGKEFFKNAANVVFIFAIPVLLCGFLLLPTAYQIMGNSRIYSSEIKFTQLAIPRYKEYFYVYTGMGLCATVCRV